MSVGRAGDWYRASVGEELLLGCPSCGSPDTRQHYDPELAACNVCGYVFIAALGKLPHYLNERNEDDDVETD